MVRGGGRGAARLPQERQLGVAHASRRAVAGVLGATPARRGHPHRRRRPGRLYRGQQLTTSRVARAQGWVTRSDSWLLGRARARRSPAAKRGPRSGKLRQGSKGRHLGMRSRGERWGWWGRGGEEEEEEKGVVRVKVVVSKQELRQMLASMSQRSSSAAQHHMAMEQLLHVLGRQRMKAADTMNGSYRGDWRPALHSIPEEIC